MSAVISPVGGLNERFQFDPESHTYRYDGVIYPGVTTVIKPLIDYSMVSEEMLRIAAERGSYAHLACELDDKGELDEESLDPTLTPYLAAWRKFRREMMAVPISNETPLYHSKLAYCCTIDRVMRFGSDTRSRLVEIKTTSQLLPATGVQLIGQQLAWEDNRGPRIYSRGAVQLRKNGTYQYKTYDDVDDLPTFHALLTTRKWLRKHTTRG